MTSRSGVWLTWSALTTVLLVSLTLFVRFGDRPFVDTSLAGPVGHGLVLSVSGVASSLGGFQFRSALLAVVLATLLARRLVREGVYVIVVVESVHIIDRALKVWIGSSRPPVTEDTRFITDWLSLMMILSGLGLTVGWWLLRGQRSRIMWLAALLPAIFMLGEIPRAISVPTGEGSFPSGHAANSMALGLAIVIVGPPRWRWALAASSAGSVAVIGASRVALGYHYPIDVLGGWLLGIAVALGVRGLMLPGPSPQLTIAR